jgi:hypothetical protein
MSPTDHRFWRVQQSQDDLNVSPNNTTMINWQDASTKRKIEAI